jgi:K+-sensing histidine kinase KdpD
MIDERELARLVERSELLDRLLRIQRSISHRAPLDEVMQAICDGLRELVDDDIAGLRLIDPDDPTQAVIVAQTGVPEHLVGRIERTPLSQGAGGKAIAENRLVVVDDYWRSPEGLEAFKRDRLQAAMAAPVHEGGEVVGSLVVASYRPGRTYSEQEQEILLAFAEHASLALSDAKAVEEMREAQRAKDMFLAMVSHELKTPLTVIMGTLHTIDKHAGSISDEARREMIASAFQRGLDLERLIDRLLKGARSELKSSFSDVFLDDLIKIAVEGFEHTCTITIDPLPVATLHTDAGAVHSILGILLENAVAHSLPGACIGVGARLAGGRIELEVRNPGRLPEGVDPAELFEPFRRGPEARSAGVGLGLYIARRLARSIGGELSLPQASDGVVRFVLSLPLDRQPAGRTA